MPKYAAGMYHPLKDAYTPPEPQIELVYVPRLAVMESTGEGLKILRFTGERY